MPIFLDVHPVKGRTKADFKRIQNAPRDKFGVIHLNLFYNIRADRWFCLHDAPSKKAVEKHHTAAGLKCDWILRVNTTATKRK
jgi:hypothetical protein